ncbi:TPA: hypothetical protein QDB15_004124 [Burkholderia vietnamiensis]|nr:NHL repeat-containing protein [Burkholderia vietnamiensis]MBR7911209.1 hypothetical protein [Burkholderia vietnamiensis]MCA8212140.1 hypothetical protein [Burkholderia vietnamiensis]HDR9100769.1 hypothetical protein [Burkholderia vietnamiensis]HDR9120306.1 hypothetical protein [Burkholderia vietnamiensis]HDR9172609.1 hypothetical protein [Burkholderia vietnamiensis]
MIKTHLIAIAVMSSVLAACGGESSSSPPPSSSAHFSVGGTVTGLISGALTLLNNGTDALAVSSNGSFVFATPLASGSSYAVTVANSPPGQSCTLSNASGTLTGNVTSVSAACIATETLVTTLAGSGAPGATDGQGLDASFASPGDLAVDAGGNVYVADSANRKIRKITPDGVVTTLAGSGEQAWNDGTGVAASFGYPIGVAVDANGNVYVADSTAQKIRKITPAGVVTTLAGSGQLGGADGSATVASFNDPAGIALDGTGNVYVADATGGRIRKISPTGVVSTLAGSGVPAYGDGTGAAASFKRPIGIAVDQSGNIYVADWGNNDIRKVTPTGVVTTLAGSNSPGSVNGTGTGASFSGPMDVAVDKSGNIYVADSNNNQIRMVTQQAVVTTLAGSSTRGDDNGPAASAKFNTPRGVAMDNDGNVYVADSYNEQIRKIILPAK